MEDQTKIIKELKEENKMQKRLLYIFAAVTLLLMICLAATMALTIQEAPHFYSSQILLIFLL